MLLMMLAALHGSAQLTDRIFGVHNPTGGVFQFSSMELSTGAVTDIQLLPMTFISSAASGTVDADAGKYIFCSGKELYTLDPNAIDAMQTATLPLAPNGNFIHIEYDPCHSALYGIVNAPPDSIVFARYDRTANAFETLLPLNSSMFFSMGGSYIDPAEGLYGLEHAGNILGIDIATATLLYDVPIIDLVGEIFGHIAFDCGTRQVLGTSFGPDPELGSGKWVSVVDPPTGIVSHLSINPTGLGLMKPASAGSCVDHTSGVFYWEGIDGVYVGANTTSGAFVYDQVASNLAPILPSNISLPVRVRRYPQ